MMVSVIIATSGRRSVLSDTLLAISRQTVAPWEVIVSCVDDEDCGPVPKGPPVRVVKGARGLTRQRNTGLDHVSPDSEIVVFFDDDFIPHPGWIEACVQHFHEHADVVGLTGTVIFDGIHGSGLSLAEAMSFIESDSNDDLQTFERPLSPYGCNMAFRKSAIGTDRFDERLVLYGWQEDRDFGARVGRRGRLVQIASAKGVHLGIKASRVSGVRLGYSQVINPFYMRDKGTMTTVNVLNHVLKNMAANVAKTPWPEPYIDRRGRLWGNMIGLSDLARRRLTPERAESL